jgi:hypothetical protein
MLYSIITTIQKPTASVLGLVDKLNKVGGKLIVAGGMNRGDRLQTDRGHGLHIDWGVCPGKMSYQWNRNNDLLIWRKAADLR